MTIKPEHVEPSPSEQDRSGLDLPELDRTDDPRGGAVVWALLAVALSLVAFGIVAMMWALGTW